MAQDDELAWHLVVEFFAPEKGIRDRAKRDHAPYEQWADMGLIHLCPGATVDYDYVGQRLIDVCDEVSMVAIAFDRWRIDVLQKALDRLEVELPLVPHGQGFKDMAPAIDDFEAACLNAQIRHGGNPVLKWCVANAQATQDPAGNRKLDKSRSTGRIDGAQATVMGFGAAGGKEPDRQKPSRYEEDGARLAEI